MARKALWKRYPIQSEVGREEELLFAASLEKIQEIGTTSVFDPVLCEWAYRYYCPQGGTILDPFAGGSVRGLVASILGYGYTGVDLRPEQVEANRTQVHIAEDVPGHGPTPTWVCGDSTQLDTFPEVVGGGPYDMLFSCPPYADLEVYSDDPADLSNMPYPEFCRLHGQVVAKAAALLRPGGYAAWVISDVRDKQGYYRGVVLDVHQNFVDAGLEPIMRAEIVDPMGSLPQRMGKQWMATRTMGRTHQNMLVYRKPLP